MLTLRLFISFALLIFAGYANAANIYVRDGGSATNCRGTDWNTANVCDSLSTAESLAQRGDTIYVADGAYGGVTLDVAESGSTRIYIKKAIASDHGTETGWVSGYGDGQATLGTVTIRSDYWTIDGQTGGGYGSYTSGHGFKITATGAAKGIRGTCDTTYSANNIQVYHVEIQGAWDDDGLGNDGIYIYSQCSDWDLSHLYIHDMGRVGILPHRVDNFTLSQSCLYHNESVSGEHAEAIAVQGGDNHVFKYNYFLSSAGTGQIVYKKDYSWQISNYVEIYGNVFSSSRSSGNGAITDTSGLGGATNYVKIYNNVFYNNSGYNVGINWLKGGTDISAYNNIWYDNKFNPVASPAAITFNNTVHNYNHFASNEANDTTLAASETQGTSSSSSPFVNASGGNFALSAQLSGLTLGAGYNSTDAAGETRGSDGIWDRGAYEYDNSGGGDDPPSVIITTPTSDTNYNTSDATIALGGTAADDVGISSVAWACSTCTPTSDTATGTTTWSEASIGVATGTNTIVVTVTDSNAQTATDTIIVYRSSGVDVTAPVISNKSPSGTVVYASSKDLELDTDETSTCKVDFSKALYDDMVYSMTASTNHHSYTKTEILPNTAYTFWARCRDTAGNTSAASEISFTTGPELPDSGLIGITGGGSLAVGLTSGSLTISW